MYRPDDDSLDQGRSANAVPSSLFCAPFDRYSLGDLLRHYRQRRTVRYFPLCEAEQTTPEFIADVLRNRFTFNGETYQFGSGPFPWKENPSADIEWSILLHKGYYLVGLGQQFRATGDRRLLAKWIELTDSWIEQVEPGHIAADVTGRRIQNWIYAFYFFVDGNPDADIPPDFLLHLLASLDAQVRFLTDNLATARNHRTLELYALFLAALVFPELNGAAERLTDSIEALADNAATDILPDGVHCELSTFYHHIVLKNLLAVKRLAAMNGLSMPARFDAAVQRALTFSLYVHKPDGRIPSLSDGDSGCFHDLLEQGFHLYGGEALNFVRSQGRSGVAPGERIKAFRDSGYFILRSPWCVKNEAYRDARYLVFDCGPLGAGNHGHLDVLNIELAAYGRSLIVDPGRYTYDESGPTNWRVLFRGTRYHNTVEVDGNDQAEYRYCERRGKFGITGAHPESALHTFVSGDSFDLLHGSVRSPIYSAVHERRIFFVDGDYWLIWDILYDRQPHDYTLRFHLGPEAVDRADVAREAGSIVIDSPNLRMVHPLAERTDVDIEPGFVSSLYGIKQAAPIVAMHRWARRTVFDLLLYPYKSRRPDIRVQPLDAELACDREAAAWAASAFSADIRSERGTVRDLFFIAHDGCRRRWRFGDIHCEGLFCFLRLGAAGDVQRFFAGPESRIDVAGKPLTEREASA